MLPGEVHREQANNYRNIICSRAEEAIKNVAASNVTMSQSTIAVGYLNVFTQQRQVEALFRWAVKDRFKGPLSLNCRLDQFHLGFVGITDAVAAKMLET